MSESSVARQHLPSVAEITKLQVDTVAAWHEGPIENLYEGFLELVCRQHEFNYRLWHEEDIARSPSADDEKIAEVKRAIDKLNQARNDMIEKLDDAITEVLQTLHIEPATDAPVNTETSGSAIDRLSIMSLRLYHYREQLERDDADAEHRNKVAARIDLCQQQHADLSLSLQQLLDDIFDAKKRHKTYRQMKMYNDPSLNPEIYNA
ncbi:DUF4254 domain-containing protein [Rhodopirellula sp. MGV]|uniref:DUF4254 domain-containing protein n=1 Tax=Rhodopirellula sp. MGV TaxID=2023130 RepID=UPI000B97221E|nr:DUF4254 domain-containing protein [Rhodopirellula sp. MGV]OYP34075.1 hypothetical protein CGZ80_16240 [Rhodopirellula sp. MGV]PNY38030.1 DUF4254 domain-containing protein [Rhodopirellula baltica]